MLTLDDARRVIAAGEKQAAAIKQPMNIAVVDEGGNLLAHIRMDGAWIGSIDIALNKPIPREPSTSPPRNWRNSASRTSNSTASRIPTTAG